MDSDDADVFAKLDKKKEAKKEDKKRELNFFQEIVDKKSRDLTRSIQRGSQGCAD